MFRPIAASDVESEGRGNEANGLMRRIDASVGVEVLSGCKRRVGCGHAAVTLFAEFQPESRSHLG